MIRLLDLFSGIGGLSLGLERSGHFHTVAFCEINPFCRQVLAKRWPGTPTYEDVTKLTGRRLEADGIAVDAICGGFPCQDVSSAGTGRGIAGSRSGLWSEFARLIGEVRPGIVVVENVALLRSRGLDRVLGDLASLGFDAEWNCIPASAVGARHRRDRIWVVAYPNGWRPHEEPISFGRRGRAAYAGRHGALRPVADPIGSGLSLPEREPVFASWWRDQRRAVAERGRRPAQPELGGVADGLPDGLDASGDAAGEAPSPWDVWQDEPEIPRIAFRVRNRVKRLKALGNAAMPQIPEMIGRAIGEAMGTTS